MLKVNAMLILMIGCPIDLRHKIIIALKIQRNEDFTNRPFLSSQPQGIISVLPNNIFREYPCPAPFFTNWGRKT